MSGSVRQPREDAALFSLDVSVLDDLGPFGGVGLLQVTQLLRRVVGPNQPFKTVADLLAAAKAQPGKLAFASGGSGTILQMQGELLQQQTGAHFIPGCAEWCR